MCSSDLEEDIKKRAQHIRELLLNAHLKEALELIQNQMSGVTDWSASSRFEDIDRSYRYMLQYYSQGSPDDHRSEVYRQLVRRALLLNDDVLQARLQPESMLLYYQHPVLQMIQEPGADLQWSQSWKGGNEGADNTEAWIRVADGPVAHRR